jgi:hypothetical protein
MVRLELASRDSRLGTASGGEMTEAARGVEPVKDAVIELPQYYVETETIRLIQAEAFSPNVLR